MQTQLAERQVYVPTQKLGAKVDVAHTYVFLR